MLVNPILNKLTEMKLSGMLKAFEEQQAMTDVDQLSFEDRFGLIVDRESVERSSRRFKSRMRKAKPKEMACFEDIDFRQKRGLDKGMIMSLASGDWIANHQNIIITGPTGVGKTYIACALLHAACKANYSAKYLRVPRFLRDIETAKLDGSYEKVLRELSRTDVILLDDLGLTKVKPDQARDLLEVMEDRHPGKSTIFTSQVESSKWYELISDPTVADALLDRIIHRAHLIKMTGQSMRKIKSGLTKKEE